MERLELVHERIRSLPGKYYCYLSCGVEIYDGPGGPAVEFDAKTLKILGTIGASLDVDIYCLGDDGGENEKMTGFLLNLLLSSPRLSAHSTSSGRRNQATTAFVTSAGTRTVPHREVRH